MSENDGLGSLSLPSHGNIMSPATAQQYEDDGPLLSIYHTMRDTREAIKQFDKTLKNMIDDARDMKRAMPTPTELAKLEKHAIAYDSKRRRTTGPGGGGGPDVASLNAEIARLTASNKKLENELQETRKYNESAIRKQYKAEEDLKTVRAELEEYKKAAAAKPPPTKKSGGAFRAKGKKVAHVSSPQCSQSSTSSVGAWGT